MNLKNLSDQMLLEETKDLVQQERTILTSILHRLREVERRRLFSSLKYPSLFEFATTELKYSKDQAARRIAAMRLLKEIPEIEEKINSGALSLTNLGLAQTLFAKEKQAGRALSSSAKANVLVQLENQSTRAAQVIVAEINPEMKPKRLVLNFDAIESEELRAKLLEVKGRFAHLDPHMTLEQLLHRLCDNELAKKTKVVRVTQVKPAVATPRKIELGLSARADQKSLAAPRVKGVTAGSMPAQPSQAEIRRQVWRRDQSKCTNCRSAHAIQIDHIIPVAVGGESTLKNMRLLCRRCNQRAAIEYFGQQKMDLFLKSPVKPYSRLPVAG